ncbi:MAG: hydrolase 1, exosortase A system-associated [Sphingopyxis sp.]|jgi:exosortase A-associated hydrolase 1|nr:hydrolase 1, exosortase A system-associated [Sphingopyxis sp.]
MRRWLTFAVEGAACAATLDDAAHDHALLIVSGGNEIRSGAHRGMAMLAGRVAAAGHPVLRFDRRGIGDSEGSNGGFESSAADITAAVAALRAQCPHVRHITAFGNCDAAAALILHWTPDIGIDALLLSNPWTIDLPAPDAEDDAPALPPAAAIRARYAAKLRDPREWWRLISGGVSIGKLVRGLRAANRKPAEATPDGAQSLGVRLSHKMAEIDVPITLLIAETDGTAQAFMAAFDSPLFRAARGRCTVKRCATGSHSFADDHARLWLDGEIMRALNPTLK